MGSVGKNAIFKIDDRDGSLTTATGALSEVGLSRSGSNAETTTLGNDAKTRVSGLKDWKLSLKGEYDESYIDLFYYSLGEARSISYQPLGTGSGDPVITGEAIGSSFSVDISFDGDVKMNCDLEGTGVLTDGTN